VVQVAASALARPSSLLRRTYSYSEEATKPSSPHFMYCGLRFTKIRFESIGAFTFAIQLLSEESLCNLGKL
jgi:hypothetical protein